MECVRGEERDFELCAPLLGLRSMQDGPIRMPDGRLVWLDEHYYIHRDGDLPAVIWPDGEQSWQCHGRCHRGNGLPAVIWPCGFKLWYVDGDLHRDDDLPAIEWPDGRRAWFVHGKHQTDADRARTRQVMAVMAEQALRWSPLRAAFTGAVAVVTAVAAVDVPRTQLDTP